MIEMARTLQTQMHLASLDVPGRADGGEVRGSTSTATSAKWAG